MTYSAIESSSFLGSPVEIYEFSRQGGIWRYTSSDEDKLVAAQLYNSEYPIRRDPIEQNQDPGKNTINVRSSRNLPFVQQYISTPPTDVVLLSIRRFHELDINNEIITIWQGRIINVTFEQDEAVIRCEPLFTSMKRPALRRLYQTTCPHVLYGPVCRAVRGSFQLVTTILSASGLTVTSTDFGLQPNGYYTGGFAEITKSGTIQRRFITDHVGTSITLNLVFNDIKAADEIIVFPGCDHSLSTCVNKFSNEENYGGFPYFPERNPFSGSPIF